MEITQQKILANALYEMFELRFSRDWDDLPEEVRAHWLDCALELEHALRGKNMVIRKMGV